MKATDWGSIVGIGRLRENQDRRRAPRIGETKTQDLLGVGLGTLITAGSNFEARVYYGWALREIARPSDDHILADEGDGTWNFSFLLRW